MKSTGWILKAAIIGAIAGTGLLYKKSHDPSAKLLKNEERNLELTTETSGPHSSTTTLSTSARPPTAGNKESLVPTESASNAIQEHGVNKEMQNGRGLIAQSDLKVESPSIEKVVQGEKAQGLLSTIKSDEEAYHFLQSVQLTDPKGAFREAKLYKNASDPAIQQLSGDHKGQLELPNEQMQLDLNFSPKMKGAHVSGVLEVEITGSSSSEVRVFHPFVGQLAGTENLPDATIVAIDRNRFVQLYYVNQLGKWYGNFYRTDATTGRLVLSGTTTLSGKPPNRIPASQ